MQKEDKSKGSVFLIPSGLGGDRPGVIWPEENYKVVNDLSVFIAEDLRTARRFLRQMGYNRDFDKVEFFLLNKHTAPEELDGFLTPALNGKNIGLLSEAGCPGIADPGQDVVRIAHKKGIRVVPMVGPSSIFLALMASGFNGQHFLFHGYLPINKAERKKKMKVLEQQAYQFDQTQVFMETPFRNNKMLEDLVNTCKPSTMLCIACDITTASEFIQTRSIVHWKKEMPDLHKRPGIFLIYKP